MPRLLSGRHVAITLAPFSNFLDQKKEEGNIDKVLAINIVEGPGARLWGHRRAHMWDSGRQYERD